MTILPTLATLPALAAALLGLASGGVVPLVGGTPEDALRASVAHGIAAPSAWAYVEDGEIVTGGAYGGTDDTPFLLGSLAKSLTAATVLQLADAGELSPDDPVGIHLPGFRAADADPLTVRDLLSHDGGFTTAAGLDATLDPGLTLADRVARAETAERAEGFAYSNLNYAVAAAVVEAVTGRPYAERLEAALLTPLGMHATTADPAAAARVAVGGNLIGFAAPLPFGVDAPLAGGADGHVVSTAADVARFLRMLLDRGTAGDGSRVLSAESVDLLLTPHVAAPGAAAPHTTDYALGWGVGSSPGGERLAAHLGNTATYSAAAAVLPGSGRAFVVLVAASGWLYDTTAAYDLTLAVLDGSVAPEGPSPVTTSVLHGFVALAALEAFAAVSFLRRRRDRRDSPSPARLRTRVVLDGAGALLVPAVWFVGVGTMLIGMPLSLGLALSASVELTALALVVAVALGVRAIAGAVRMARTGRELTLAA